MLKIISILLMISNINAQNCAQPSIMSFDVNTPIADIEEYNNCIEIIKTDKNNKDFCTDCINFNDLQSKIYQSGKKRRSKDHQDIQKSFEKNLHQAILDEFKKSTLKNMRSVLLLNQDIN